MASGDLDHQHTRDSTGTSDQTPSLLDLLSNTLVLYQTIPYLPISSILHIAATSRSFRHLLHTTPGVFRHLDLTRVSTAQFDIDEIDHGGEVWRNVQVDENLTEDDFYSGPLRGIFTSLRRRNILRHVNTLVLDGLSVTSEFLNDILVDPASRIRVLSVREVKNLNERKLMQALRYACRPTRPDDTPRLKALYYFGKRDADPLPVARASSTGAAANISAGWNQKSQNALKESIEGGEGEEDWYSRKGRMISKPIADGWAETILDCREALRFDTVLCTGPRHRNSPAFGKTPHLTPAGGSPWGVATFAVGGCASCGSAPEGFTTYGDSPSEELPLLSPIPLHSSSIKSAMRPTASDRQRRRHEFVPRCLECIRERYCFSCNQWWCETCYQVPSREEHEQQLLLLTQQQHHHPHLIVNPDTDNDNNNNGGGGDLDDHEKAALAGQLKIKTPKITRSCWECEHNCLDCIAETQKRCTACGGGYCIIHHEGSTLKLCDCKTDET
ncbi:hypothetical protein FHL15_009890 [Xylaria flabelliformis]|uniref:F-box domain-containing protein n=1 Tax=Xylaria flabelliformis TaxID=2512241 RepID=A0A553HMK5_9PEZI|nr:hypothetical protein FHL15_009890 [Xylaria flabelliformis]